MKHHLRAMVLCLALAFSVASCTVTPEEAPGARPLGVLGSAYQEVTLLRRILAEPRVHQIEGIEFVEGRVGTEPVVLAWTGVGKVNAAMTATLLLEHFQPRQVIFTGIAGGVDPNLEPGDIVIAKQTAYHDMGTLTAGGIDYGGVKSRMTGEPNPVFFPADPGLLATARQAARDVALGSVGLRTGRRPPKVTVGTVVTGDTFVASREKSAELVERLGASAVEMEGAAVAQLCYQREIGCLVIRSISDKADQSAVMDKQLFYSKAAENAAGLVEKMIREGKGRGAE